MSIKNILSSVWNPFKESRDEFISLKITERDIKIIQLKKKKEHYSVVNAIEVRTPELSVMENIIIDSEQVSCAIKEAYELGGFNCKDVVIGLNSNEVIVKKITIPIMAEKDIIDYAYIEVANHIPYKPEDVYVDYILLGASQEDNTKMNIFLIACKKEIIETYTELLCDSNLRLKYVDCDVFALYNIHDLKMKENINTKESDNYRADISQAFINIGYSSSSIIVTFDSEIRMASSSGFGTKFIDQKMANDLLMGDLDHDKIVEYKKGNAELYISYYYDYFDYITSELSVALNHYNGTNSEFPVEHVHISGGGILLENALVEIESRLGVKVSLFNPFGDVLKYKKPKDFNIERDGYRFSLVSGLSVRS